jgi:hypothetical protein
MKTLFILALGIIFLPSCKKDEVPVLSDQEKSDLLFLREEEKLARDVYIYSYNKYGLAVFNNISGSEQNHMNSVLNILEKYGLTDPAGSNEVGVFSNKELQSLYDQLTAKAAISLEDALAVGANIEDLDINDIKTFYMHTTKSDLLTVYDRLTCGSKNHLRSFVAQLGTYSPVYLTQAEYEAILSGSNGHCGN